MRKKKAKKKEIKIHKACLAILYKSERGSVTGVVIPFCGGGGGLQSEKGKSVVGEFDTPKEAFAALETVMRGSFNAVKTMKYE